jgi:hypothetical protein
MRQPPYSRGALEDTGETGRIVCHGYAPATRSANRMARDTFRITFATPSRPPPRRVSLFAEAHSHQLEIGSRFFV